MLADLLAAVPWWGWLLIAWGAAVAAFGRLCDRAPYDTDIWPGGEPRTPKGHQTSDERWRS